MFDIITFGSAVRDLFVKSKDFKTLKDKRFITGQGLCFNLGSKIKVDDIFFSTGGGGTNSAATFAKQGFKTAYIGRIGNDPGGQTVKQELNKLGIRPFLKIDKNKNTPYSIVLSVSKKERTILVYQGASHDLEKSDIPFSKLKTQWFYIAGLSGKSAKILEPIVNFAKKNNIKVTLDPSSSQLKLGLQKLKPVLQKLDVFKLNREEAARLVGLPYNKEKEIFKELSRSLSGSRQESGDKIIVMTKGSKGVVVSDGKYLYQAGIFKERRYVDRTGAGDAFGAGFIAGLLQDPNPKSQILNAIRLGSANATSIVEFFGAKNGILSKNQFLKDKRWKQLKIIKSKI